MKTLKTFAKKNNVKTLNTKQTSKVNGGCAELIELAFCKPDEKGNDDGNRA